MFDALKEIFNDSAANDDERYSFNWAGKTAARANAYRHIDKTLRPCLEESLNWDTTENLYIEGDNLEVLKLLQESYLRKIRMIYIDPPYNTGSDFVYPDSFIMDNEDYNEGTGYFDEDGNVNFGRENGASAGRYHSDWCSMMYSRLMLARNLLADDGVIYISIDDNEIDNLAKVCNEIFGESNFISQIPWQSRASIQNDTDISINHEYLLVYAKVRRHENRRLKESNYAIWHKKQDFVCQPLPLDKTKFDNPDRALGYIIDEFRNCSDFECEINEKLNDDRDKGN